MPQHTEIQAAKADIAVSWSKACETRAIAFARLYKLPIINELHDWRGLCFHLDEDGWSILGEQEARESAFVLSFTPKFRAQGKDPLLKAMGKAASVLDLTAGWGGDSLHIAQSGIKVVAVERHPVVYQMLEQALAGLQAELAQHLRFLHLDSAQHNFPYQLSLELGPHDDFDLVYLDPMFQGGAQKRAKSRKPMQIMQQMVSPPTPDNEVSLLDNAMKIARKRVVVKRALNAPFIDERVPQGSIKSKLLRFDLYKP